MKSGVYHTKGPVVYVNETNALTGQDVTYNSQNGSMTMDKVEASSARRHTSAGPMPKCTIISAISSMA